MASWSRPTPRDPSRGARRVLDPWSRRGRHRRHHDPAPTHHRHQGAPCTSADSCAAGQQCDQGRCFWSRQSARSRPLYVQQYCKSGLCAGTADEQICTQTASSASPIAAGRVHRLETSPNRALLVADETCEGAVAAAGGRGQPARMAPVLAMASWRCSSWSAPSASATLIRCEAMRSLTATLLVLCSDGGPAIATPTPPPRRRAQLMCRARDASYSCSMGGLARRRKAADELPVGRPAVQGPRAVRTSIQLLFAAFRSSIRSPSSTW